MAAAWAWAEVAAAKVRDRRRIRSLATICTKLAENAGLSLSAALGPATRQAAHRLFSHPHLQPMDLLQGHITETARRCAAYSLVLVAQDSSEYCYAHPATTGLGAVRSPTARGFHGHSALALSPDGEPLGLLSLAFWTRPRATTGKKHQRHQLPTEEKESQKWRDGLAAVERALAPHQTILLIQDREGDAFAFFAAPRRPTTHLLIRAHEPRRARVVTEPEVPASNLLELAAAAPELAPLEVALPARPGTKGAAAQPARIARLSVRATRVRVERPRSIRKVEELPRHTELWVVRATEQEPPAGAEPVDWVLLTTWPVLDGATACQIVRYYARRWAIERVHWVLKSGLGVERLQIDDAASLQNALAVYGIVAWRVLALTHAARTQPEAPAAAFLSAAEQAVLQHVAGTPVPTVQQAVHAIARLGGWEAYRKAPAPGPKTLWQGLRRLAAMVEGWELAFAAMREGPPEI